jgi:hypothetical protein
MLVGLGDGDTVGLKAFDVKADRIADFALHDADRFAGGYTTRNIGHIGSIVTAGFLDHDCVAHLDLPYSHFFHLKMRYGTTAAASIAISAS